MDFKTMSNNRNIDTELSWKIIESYKIHFEINLYFKLF